MCFVDVLCWWEVIHTVALTDIYPERYISPPGALHIDTDYVAPPEVVYVARRPIHNTGRYIAGVALHTATATYRVQARHIGRGHFPDACKFYPSSGTGQDEEPPSQSFLFLLF